MDTPQQRRGEELPSSRAILRIAQHVIWALCVLATVVLITRPELASTVWSSVTTLIEIGVGVLIGRHLDSVF